MNKKKNTLCVFFILSISLCGLSPSSLAQRSGEFIFEGQIDNADTSEVYLEYRNENNKYIVDSCKLNNGNFRFTGTISQPTLAYFKENKKIHLIDSRQLVRIYLEPGVMRGNFEYKNLKKGTISGSTTQRESQLLEKKLKGVNGEARYEIIHNFIYNYPRSYVSIYMLGMMQGTHLTNNTVAFLYSRMPPEIQHSRYGGWLRDQLTKEKKLKPGHPAPGFRQPDMNGSIKTLQDFKGKYILLDFWASWCIPCRNEMKYIKEIKDANQNKNLTIIGISLDTDKNKWLAAIKSEKLDWLQLSDLKGRRNTAALKYNSIIIPSYFLIDPNGVIQVSNVSGKKLIESVNRILNKKK